MRPDVRATKAIASGRPGFLSDASFRVFPSGSVRTRLPGIDLPNGSPEKRRLTTTEVGGKPDRRSSLTSWSSRTTSSPVVSKASHSFFGPLNVGRVWYSWNFPFLIQDTLATAASIAFRPLLDLAGRNGLGSNAFLLPVFFLDFFLGGFE